MLGFEGAPVSTIGALYDHISPAVEDAGFATVMTFRRAVPAPRRDPLHGRIEALQQRREATAAYRPTV